MLDEEGFGSPVCQSSRTRVVMTAIVAREGMIAAGVAEDFCAGKGEKPADPLALGKQVGALGRQ
jgi:hypothetical protein